MSTTARGAIHGWCRLECLVALALGVLVAAAWIGSALHERRALESQLPHMLEEVARKQPMAINLEPLKEQRDFIHQILEASQRQFPASFDADGLQRDLTQQANAQGLALVEIVRGEEALREYFGELDFDLTLRGPPGSVYGFVENLTLWLPIKHVRALDLRAEHANSGVLTAKLKLVYFRSVDLHGNSHDSKP